MPSTKKSASNRDILHRLDALARNLWWSWQPDAQRLFASMDPALWDATHHNPIKTLRLLPAERRDVIQNDPRFTAHLKRVEDSLREYLSTKTWFERTYDRRPAHKKARTPKKGSGPFFRTGANQRSPLVAYFCAEFAVHECLPQYSGGLGVLAGDHVKSASDLGVPLVGVGLLYRNGYYTHEFAADGSTRVVYPLIDFADVPITDTGRTIDVPMGAKSIKAKIWRQLVGRTQLFLLDTDVEGNSADDRKLTRHLYGGDREYRIKQEILLGVGGIIALDAMGLKPTVYHLNEGHAAFAALERLRRLVHRGVSFDEAVATVAANTVFTTHTPVPAGHDRFDAKMMKKYLGRQMDSIGADWLGLGRENPDDTKSEFVMTVLAIQLSSHRNGVAALHGEVSREMWQHLFGVQNVDDVPIGHVTNGVHTQTWLAPEIRPLYDKYLKPRWNRAGPEEDFWKNAGRISPAELWNVRRILRGRMIRFIRQRMVDHVMRQHGNEQQLLNAQAMFDDDALTIGFARRFATYKRAPLVFRNAKRLARILGNEDRPVQIVFAGKPHPADIGGQEFAQEIYKHAGENAFQGRVAILEDYDMEMGRMLTSGCDVWLNNPLRPQEASGTSGMKPPLHGGINCSILDGWWPEAYCEVNGRGKNGWAIGDGTQLSDRSKQDTRDADAIYRLLENEIAPEFYDRDANDVPRKWVARMIASMQTVCAQFSTSRMVGDYCTKYYMPAHAH
ncbi:MAG: alpha-glucan family phosphorylase [Anaerolineae bacterium]|nr:alpha-glucan family phosphorylase [Phycisphaerae bacterium]